MSEAHYKYASIRVCTTPEFLPFFRFSASPLSDKYKYPNGNTGFGGNFESEQSVRGLTKTGLI